MIRLDKQRRRIWKRLVLRKPLRVRMPVRRKNRQILHRLVQLRPPPLRAAPSAGNNLCSCNIVTLHCSLTSLTNWPDQCTTGPPRVHSRTFSPSSQGICFSLPHTGAKSIPTECSNGAPHRVPRPAKQWQSTECNTACRCRPCCSSHGPCRSLLWSCSECRSRYLSRSSCRSPGSCRRPVLRAVRTLYDEPDHAFLNVPSSARRSLPPRQAIQSPA